MIPLFKPYIPEVLPELDNIFHSEQLAYGKYALEFEKNLAKYIGIDKVLCTNSFNSAYLVLIRVLGLQPGDEVIASPMCCLASSQPFAVSGIKLKWADIDPTTGTLDPDSVRRAIGSATKAIVHNHFCGYVGYVDEIRYIAHKRGILLIDDVSESFGSLYKGLKAGNWGADATVYSFQTIRLPNAIEGGAVSFSKEEHYKKAMLIRDYGIDRPRFRDDLGEISPLCNIELAAYGCMTSDVNAYLGTLSLKATPDLIARQRENAISIANSLPAGVSPLRPVDDTVPNYWVFGAMADDKQAFLKRTKTEKKIGISSVHLPNTFYSLFGTQAPCLGVNDFFKHFVALPSGWWI